MRQSLPDCSKTIVHCRYSKERILVWLNGNLKITVNVYCSIIKKLLSSNSIRNDRKHLSKEICMRHNVDIAYMETEKDHIHDMIETEPNSNLSNLVRTMKRYTTYHIGRKYRNYLSKCFWKEHTFWTEGYFICSVGNVSEKIRKEYIENQG